MRQFAKVLSFKDGIYSLSGWSDKETATKAQSAAIHVNEYGLAAAGAKIATKGKDGALETPAPVIVTRPRRQQITPKKRVTSKANIIAASGDKAGRSTKVTRNAPAKRVTKVAAKKRAAKTVRKSAAKRGK